MEPTPSTQGASLNSQIQPWIQAARPAAHPMIFIPLFLGQAMAFRVQAYITLALFLYTLLFGVVYQIFLLYLNDYADEAIDRTNEQYWLSGGSRVIPQGKLQRNDLLVGAKVAFAAMMVLSLFLAFFFDRPWLPVYAVLGVTLCWAYNLRPLQLSYRGRGEILQGLGCGVLLPLVGFYMQTGILLGFPWLALIPLYLMFHASNIITALPDYQSDKEGGKKTYPVRRGELRARTTAVLLLTLAYVSFTLSSLYISATPLAVIVIPSSLILIGVVKTGLLRKANVSEFSLCKKFVFWTSASQAWLLCSWSVVLLLDRWL